MQALLLEGIYLPRKKNRLASTSWRSHFRFHQKHFMEPLGHCIHSIIDEIAGDRHGHHVNIYWHKLYGRTRWAVSEFSTMRSSK